MHPAVDLWLQRFTLDASLTEHVRAVVLDLPEHVRRDLLDDPRFTLCDYDPHQGRTHQILVGVPAYSDDSTGSSRSVALKRTLRARAAPFVRWVIAHELAHAYLRNEGRVPGEDPEHAADALAAEWGFPRPPR